MAAFAQFGSDLDKATQEKLAQGERLMELFKQPQYSPYTTAQQYAVLYAAVNGLLLDVKTAEMRVFIKGYLDYIDTHHREFMENLDKTGESTAGIDQILMEAIGTYKEMASHK